MPLVVIDSYKFVTCWIIPTKQDYSSRTIRPKIHKLLGKFFSPLPELKKHSISSNFTIESTNWLKIYESLNIDLSVNEVSWLQPGELNARKNLQQFINTNLKLYAAQKNDSTT